MFIAELMCRYFRPHLNSIIEYILRKKCLEEGVHFDRYVEYKKIESDSTKYMHFHPETFEQMCILLALEIEVFSNIDCEYYKHEIEVKDNRVFNTLNEEIDLHEYMFKKIFNNEYSDMINYKIIYDDGNFRLFIFEFSNSYFVIEYSNS